MSNECYYQNFFYKTVNIFTKFIKLNFVQFKN